MENTEQESMKKERQEMKERGPKTGGITGSTEDQYDSYWSPKEHPLCGIGTMQMDVRDFWFQVLCEKKREDEAGLVCNRDHERIATRARDKKAAGEEARIGQKGRRLLEQLLTVEEGLWDVKKDNRVLQVGQDQVLLVRRFSKSEGNEHVVMECSLLESKQDNLKELRGLMTVYGIRSQKGGKWIIQRIEHEEVYQQINQESALSKIQNQWTEDWVNTQFAQCSAVEKEQCRKSVLWTRIQSYNTQGAIEQQTWCVNSDSTTKKESQWWECSKESPTSAEVYRNFDDEWMFYQAWPIHPKDLELKRKGVLGNELRVLDLQNDAEVTEKSPLNIQRLANAKELDLNEVERAIEDLILQQNNKTMPEDLEKQKEKWRAKFSEAFHQGSGMVLVKEGEEQRVWMRRTGCSNFLIEKAKVWVEIQALQKEVKIGTKERKETVASSSPPTRRRL